LQMLPNCVSSTNVNYCDECSPGYIVASYIICLSTQVANCSSGTLPRKVGSINFCQAYYVYNCQTLAVKGDFC
jgi:hypothetical protein